MGNSLGKSFTITSFGESHGDCMGIVIDGCSAGLDINVDDIQREVDKRKAGARAASTARREDDKIEVFSGVFNGRTTGAPICLIIWNKDIDSSEYEVIKDLPRPGHADYAARIKYGGCNDFRGGGRFSGRITAGFVMAGSVAIKLLATAGIEVLAHTTEIGGIPAAAKGVDEIRANIGLNEVNCADAEAAARMVAAIEKAKRQGDSLGGIIEGMALNVPVGLGEPVFDTLEGDLAKALYAIPAVKGVEFGAGFAATRMTGSSNNDQLSIKKGEITALGNNAGGISGGISNGMPIVARVAVKPTPSIAKEQRTVDLAKMKESDLVIKGRHDACIVPRAVAVVESMMAITLVDFALRAGLIPRVLQ
jgi:chorismate synthase